MVVDDVESCGDGSWWKADRMRVERRRGEELELVRIGERRIGGGVVGTVDLELGTGMDRLDWSVVGKRSSTRFQEHFSQSWEERRLRLSPKLTLLSARIWCS